MQGLLGLAIVAEHALHFAWADFLPAAWWSSRLTGGAFFLSALSTLLLARGRAAAGQIVALAVLVFAVLIGLGHLFPNADLYEVLPGTGVAIPTILSFVALSLGQVLSQRGSGVSAALTARNAAGRAGMRLLVAGVALVLLLTVALAAAHRRGHFDATTAVLLVGWSAVGIQALALWGLALTVDRAEAARVRAEAGRDQLRQMVAAAVTHDLRSPLQSAVLSAALVERLVSDGAATAALARLKRSHARIERLLRSLLDSLSVGQGQALALHASQVDLGELVREVIAENEAVLATRVGAKGSATGWWDRDALLRVLENLLLNAVKYGAPGTVIDCCIDTQPSGAAVLRVINQGEPIPREEWETIFLPFSRGAHARGTQPIGWGVGLAYSRSVAASHGGTVRVAWSDERGTSFELTLPADSRAHLAARSA